MSVDSGRCQVVVLHVGDGNSMQLSPFEEANSSSTSLEIPRIL